MREHTLLTHKQVLLQFIVAISALYVATIPVAGVLVEGWVSIFIAVIIIQLVQWVLKPVFSAVSKTAGIAGILLLSLFGNALVVWIAFGVLPGITINSFWDGVIVSWLYAAIITLLNWMLLSQSDDIFLSNVFKEYGKQLTTPKKPGFLFVQLDGVSAPVLDWQLKAGNLPTISRLLRDEGYEFKTWHTQIPSTTPASQAGILFGNNDGIPAFRWFEKSTGQLIVANQSAGAALIEERCSSGQGLLVDGGVSIGNLFSGDATENIMVMSKISGDKQSIKSMRQYTSYFYKPYNFMRNFVLALGEMSKEIYQAKKQEIQRVEPRVNRHGSYVFLRAATNVLLRDLQTTIVIEKMIKGVNSIYVDYLDYDEVAHHAGIARAESLASLTGLDRVVGILCRANKLLPSPYEIILVSDHGQSQGPTFKQLHNGKTLKDFIVEFTHSNGRVLESTEPVENSSSAKSLLAQQSSPNSMFKSSAQKKLNTMDSLDTALIDTEIVVTGSGNLGNIWFSSEKRQLQQHDIQKRYPNLVSDLLNTKGIGLVLLHTPTGSVCIGAQGTIHLDSRKIIGHNPLHVYPEDTVAALAKVAGMKNAPDITVISEYNQQTGEVYAFEELVGNHGGIGGWQTQAILLHPKKLEVPNKFLNNGTLQDAVTIHKVFKHWLREAGHK